MSDDSYRIAAEQREGSDAWLGDPAYCHDDRHETPCPLPCEACEAECDKAHRG